MTTAKPMSFLMNCGDAMCATKTKTIDEREDDQDAIEAMVSTFFKLFRDFSKELRAAEKVGSGTPTPTPQ